MATTQQTASNNPTPATRAPKRKTRGKPAAVVGYGSAKMPVYRCAPGGRIRFAISYHREGRRMRQFFTNLAAAKKEALLVAQRIQGGMRHVTDLKPHDRENYLAACAKLADTGIPLVAAVEDYLRARRIAGSESLSGMAAEYTRHFGGIIRHATVPDVVRQLLASKELKRLPGLQSLSGVVYSITDPPVDLIRGIVDAKLAELAGGVARVRHRAGLESG